MQPRVSIQIVAVISLSLTVVTAWNYSLEQGPLTAIDCADWNSKEYFRAALAADMTDCLQSGADPKARNEEGFTPLHFAALLNKNPAVIAALLDAGADLKARDKDGFTPLHRAAVINESPAIIAALLDAGADLKARDKLGGTPLHWAAGSNENPAIITALLDAGADLKARDKHGGTPLRFRGPVRGCLRYLDAGADLKARDYHGGIHFDSDWLGPAENPAVIEALLDAGADLKARDEGGLTPLHWAARSNESPAIITALLDAGADPKARDSLGETPWDCVKDRKPLKGSKAYWRLNDAQF